MDVLPLSEEAWAALEGMRVALLPAPGSAEESNGQVLKGFVASIVADFLAVYANLVTIQGSRLPIGAGAVLRRALGVLRLNAKPGQSWADSETRVEVLEGEDDSGKRYMSYVLAAASAGRPGGRLLSVGLFADRLGAASVLSLPFDFAGLQEVDATERVTISSIAREGADVLVSRLTARSGSYLKMPCDFGLLIKESGERRWLSGSLDLASAPFARAAPVVASPVPRLRDNAGSTRPRAASPTLSYEGGVSTVPQDRRDLSASASEISCPQCRATILYNAAFCASCGTPINGLPAKNGQEDPAAPNQCGRCATSLSAGAKFCPHCGERAVQSATTVPFSASSAPRTCPSCGAANGRRSVFCRECGSALATPAGDVPPTCASCGSRVSLGSKFCGGCGQPVPARR